VEILEREAPRVFSVAGQVIQSLQRRVRALAIFDDTQFSDGRD
jgi:hypothetical protein